MSPAPSIGNNNMTEDELKAALFLDKLPRHIAITMDGNGRWAKRRNLPRTEGHRQGAKPVPSIVRLCGDLDIAVLTLYAFSSENWKRPYREVNAIMKLLINQLEEETPEMKENNVRLRIIGNISRLPGKVLKTIKESVDATRDNTGLILNLAISYGGREEIIRAVQSVVADVNRGNIKPSDINEELFSQYLDTAGLPDPDLLIRTGGELRISNLLIWQSAYSEIYVTDVLWPDFGKKDLLQALLAYQKRKRRFGGI